MNKVYKYPIYVTVTFIFGSIGFSLMVCFWNPYAIHLISAMFAICMITIGQVLDAMNWIQYIKYIKQRQNCLLNAYSLMCPLIAWICFIVWIIPQTGHCPLTEWVGMLLIMIGFMTQIYHTSTIQNI